MTFGDELGRLLDERGMSQRELARRSHYDSGYVNKLVRGVKQATPEVAGRLDEVLDAGGTLMALVNRRKVLAGAAAIAGAPLLAALDTERLAWTQRHPRRIDQAAVDSLTSLLTAQRRLVPPDLKDRPELRDGDLGSVFVDDINTIRAAVASAATGDGPFTLTESAVNISFAVTAEGAISLGADGGLTNELTHTLTLGLVPA
jgi:plasmid maintenance system antidote protein VapI